MLTERHEHPHAGVTVREAVKWAHDCGYERLAVVLPHLQAEPLLSNPRALSRVLAVRDVVREQRALGALFAAAVRELPGRHAVELIEDSPNVAQYLYTKTVKPDCVVSVHPVRPPCSASEETAQIKIVFLPEEQL